MAPTAASMTPNLASFLKNISTEPVEHSIEQFIALVRRRQIKGSKPCAIATAYLLRRVISVTRAWDPAKLIHRVHEVGKRLVTAQPREVVVGNIIRRILGLIRDEEDEKRGDGDFSGVSSEADSEPPTPQIEKAAAFSLAAASTISPPRNSPRNPSPTRPPLISSHTGPPGTRQVTSMFSILSHPTMMTSGNSTPVRSGTATPQPGGSRGDLRAEVMEGISEIIDELDQSDDQIASYAADHIHASEIILTYSASITVQRFLLKAASKRKFTLIIAEAYPNNHTKTHALLTGNMADSDEMTTDSFSKPLTSAGVTVVMIADSAIFALMSRANKVILGAHAVFSNGSLVAAAGTKMVCKAARHHRVPVMVLCGTYKLAPRYPYDPTNLIEYGDVGKMVPYADAEFRARVSVENPLYDFVDADCVDLFVTNLGGVATGYVYRIVRDQYRDEDVDL